MSVQILRLKKEARAIFWPWCAIVLARLLLYLPIHPESTGVFLTQGLLDALVGAFWLGIPLLAALPFGIEFQHQTMGLLFSQPMDRREIWHEKWLVMVSAIVSAGALYWVGPGAFAGLTGFSVIAGMWVVITICSAAFWSLTAGSVIGAM